MKSVIAFARMQEAAGIINQQAVMLRNGETDTHGACKKSREAAQKLIDIIDNDKE